MNGLATTVWRTLEFWPPASRTEMRQAIGLVCFMFFPSEAHQLPLKKGKIDGKVIRIEMENNPILFVLTLEGDKLTGEIDDAEEPSKVLAKVDPNRKELERTVRRRVAHLFAFCAERPGFLSHVFFFPTTQIQPLARSSKISISV
jgi:hypothetical protein